MMKIAIAGCSGRMGLALVREVAFNRDAGLAGGFEHKGHAALGRDLGELAGIDSVGVKVTDDARAVIEQCDALIDFTRPEATLEFLSLTSLMKKAHVIGTTGFTAEQEARVKGYAQQIPIVWSYNMSLGVNILAALTRQVASLLGPEYDIEIVEMHHKHKVDAPSGTALLLGRSAAEGRGVDFDREKVLSREGQTGPRKAGTIGFATLRGGDVVGDHTVIFAGEGERIELTHKSASREIYARGAVRAALWTQGKKPGLYSMKDVLGF